MHTFEEVQYLEQLRSEAIIGADILPAELRESQSVSEDAVESLIYYLGDNPDRQHSLFNPDHLGHDLHRLFGGDGFDHYAMATALLGDRDGSIARLTAGTNDEYLDARWSSFKRAQMPGDRLLIDVMDEAEAYGWIAPSEIKVALEVLRDEAATVRALRNRIDETTYAALEAIMQVTGTVKHEDFWAYSPAHSYIFVPTGEHWPASTVNSRLAAVIVPMREKPISAAAYLDQNRSVEQATWAPGQPQIIENRLIADGGWIDRAGCKTYNLYRPPTIRPKAGDASPWVKHIHWIYPEEAEHIIRWLAQRVQRPDVKINHALVLGGNQGIGKDTLLEPVKAAVGPWNCSEVSPQQVLGRFNSFVKSVILRISEARDLGDTDRFAFYEHLKTLTAAPPDVLRVDEKHLREHAVLNVCGVIQTTNNKDALHLPADDRRHFIAWSPRNKDDFVPGYWSALYKWFVSGGNEIVAHHLATLDLSAFDAKAPPPKTAAFWEIVDASRAPEDAEMADAIDALGKPAAVTTQQVIIHASIGFREWLRDRRNRRKIGHRFEGCGYVPVRNPDDARDGQWKIGGRRQTVYAKTELSLRDRLVAAERLTALPSPP